jgi:hypothetical protein
MEICACRVTASPAGENQVIQFAAGEPHNYANTGTVTARLIMTIDYAV